MGEIDAAMESGVSSSAGFWDMQGSAQELALPAFLACLVACGLARGLHLGIRSFLCIVSERDEHDRRFQEIDCRPWGLSRVFRIIEGDGAARTKGGPGMPQAASIGGSEPLVSFGLALWDSSVTLSQHLVERRAELRASCFGDGKSVIEIGCGQPLLSMCVIEAFPDLGRVVITDGHEGVIRLARQNLEANIPEPKPALALARLLWGNVADEDRALEINDGVPYDVVLGADVTYDGDLGGALVDTIMRLSDADTVVYLAHERREGKIEDAATVFKADLEERFTTVTVARYDLPPGGHTGRAKAETGTCEVWRCTGKRDI